MMKIIPSELLARKRKLESVRKALKQEFFGIDECIDKIIESIKTWYLLPDIVTRPVIVNLWGLTGVGKTALARSLASQLGFGGKFVEIQMDGFSNAQSYSQPSSICEILQSSSIEEGDAGIVLLDEFQRYRTKDENGRDAAVVRYQDVWQLLSDGYFSSDYSSLTRIEQQLAYMEYDNDREEQRKAEEKVAQEAKAKETKPKEPSSEEKLMDKIFGTDPKEEVKTVTFKRKYSLYPYEAKSIKKLLHLKEPLMDIMTWSGTKVIQLIREHAQNNENKTIDYTKCLIIVSGNLDEAFTIAEDVEDCDTSADVFYEHTKKIGVIEIKQALVKRFHAEQIARLGNNHIVYPSLRGSAYMSIIRRACGQYIAKAKEISGITFTIAGSVYDEIYNNSVYPTQGARPVFTSIHKMFGSPLSDAVLWGLEKDLKKLSINLDTKTSSLVFSYHRLQKKVHIDFELRNRRNRRSADFNALVAIHEAGHAIVYAELFKTAPVEVAINIASFNGGYNIFKETYHSKTELLHRIAVGMAGIVAEEIVFGQEMRSTGCGPDVDLATQNAGYYVRHYAMDGHNAKIVSETSPVSNLYDVRLNESSKAVEAIVKEQKEIAQTILTKRRRLLVKLARRLLEVKKIDSKTFVAFAHKYLSIAPATDKDVNGNYAEKLEKA